MNRIGKLMDRVKPRPVCLFRECAWLAPCVEDCDGSDYMNKCKLVKEGDVLKAVKRNAEG